MNQSREQLLDAVKKAVARYGISGMTTRKLAEAAGINDGLIYHYFDDKENIFKEAYERESNAIFLPMLGYIRELRDISLHFGGCFPRRLKIWMSDQNGGKRNEQD